MDSSEQYVTKKELYSVAWYVCCLILFTAALSNQGASARASIVYLALGSQLYFLYKLYKAKRKVVDLQKV